MAGNDREQLLLFNFFQFFPASKSSEAKTVTKIQIFRGKGALYRDTEREIQSARYISMVCR